MEVLALPPFSSHLTQLAQLGLAAQAVHCTNWGHHLLDYNIITPGVKPYGGPEAPIPSLSFSRWSLDLTCHGTDPSLTGQLLTASMPGLQPPLV